MPIQFQILLDLLLVYSYLRITLLVQQMNLLPQSSTEYTTHCDTFCTSLLFDEVCTSLLFDEVCTSLLFDEVCTSLLFDEINLCL